jgi:hypothetical protein
VVLISTSGAAGQSSDCEPGGSVVSCNRGVAALSRGDFAADKPLGRRSKNSGGTHKVRYREDQAGAIDPEQGLNEARMSSGILHPGASWPPNERLIFHAGAIPWQRP